MAVVKAGPLSAVTPRRARLTTATPPQHHSQHHHIATSQQLLRPASEPKGHTLFCRSVAAPSARVFRAPSRCEKSALSKTPAVQRRTRIVGGSRRAAAGWLRARAGREWVERNAHLKVGGCLVLPRLEHFRQLEANGRPKVFEPLERARRQLAQVVLLSGGGGRGARRGLAGLHVELWDRGSPGLRVAVIAHR